MLLNLFIGLQIIYKDSLQVMTSYNILWNAMAILYRLSKSTGWDALTRKARVLVAVGPSPIAGPDASHSLKFMLASGIGEGPISGAANVGNNNDRSMGGAKILAPSDALAYPGFGAKGYAGGRQFRRGSIRGVADGERDKNAPTGGARGGAEASVLNDAVNPVSKVYVDENVNSAIL